MSFVFAVRSPLTNWPVDRSIVDIRSKTRELIYSCHFEEQRR